MSDTDVRWRGQKVIQDQSNRLVTDTQIERWDNKTDPGHKHTKSDITDFPTSMPASDVKAWAKADNKPSYVWNEIGNKPTQYNPSAHNHTKSDITDFPDSIKNPLSITIMLNGGNTEGKNLFTYDGSVAKTINITYANIGAASKEHYHDDRYYTEEETDKLLKGVSSGVFENLTWDKILDKPSAFVPINHTHSKSEITDFPLSMKNPTNIIIKLNGGIIEGNNMFTYDGSIEKTIDITAPDIGASSIGHIHAVKDIEDFPASMPASDVYDWAKEKFKPSYVWNEIGEKPTEFNPIAHKHVVREITDFPTTMKNPYSISIRLNNGITEDLDLFTYNGDGEKSINITPIKIGAADRVHTHTKSQITDFPETLRNPAFLTIKLDNMADKSITSDSYDGSSTKTITAASNTHKHLKQDILDFPDSIKNPKNITLILSNGVTTTQDFYDGSEAKTFEVAAAKHTHTKSEFTDFPVSIKNPYSVTIVTNDGKTTTSDSYDGSSAKTFNLASAKHVHNKSEITDFPTTMKNPTAITITLSDGKTKTQDSYDGSSAKVFDVATAKHVHTKSEITDFPTTMKNPNTLVVNTNDGKTSTQSKYDGSATTTINVASSKHVHTKSEITDFPTTMKNPYSINIAIYNGSGIVTDSYDGSATKTFNVASSNHTHVKANIVDFPDSIKNPANIVLNVSDGKTSTQTTYDGSEEKILDLANAQHVHTKSEITDFPASIKNPTSLSIQLNGGAATVYDGSVARSINITPAGIGASANTHLHDDRYYTESEIDTKLNGINNTLSSHNHTKLRAVASTTTVPGKSDDGFMTYHYNVNNGLANNMPTTNNANAILTISRHGGDYTTQLGFSSNDNIYYRNGVGTTAWKRLLDSSNYNDYAPTKTGTGASGTWGISITGKANTASVADSANAVAWGNVSGKPTSYTPSTHTHTKSQITDFPASLKNPTNIIIRLNGGTTEGTNQFTYDGSTAKIISITPAGIGASASNHTHNYAGSSSSGGSATSAVKLDTATAGSATQPVYFTGGKPVACTYTLGKSVPSDAKFTDTNTWRGIQNNLTSDSTSDSLAAAQGKALKALIDGKAASSHTHNYAGSSSAGGSATSAVKLDTTTAGSATQPVYFTGGKPAACTYTLGKSVPSNAVFTDTNTWRGIQNNLTSDSTSDSLSAAQGKVLKGLVDGKASSSHNHDSTYLKLSGGTVTGRITRSSGGAWISQRDYATVYQSYVTSSSANPVAAVKTPSGAWAIGSLGGTENLCFSYTTDTNYNAGNNSANVIYLPTTSGTLALTSNLSAYLPLSGGTLSGTNQTPLIINGVANNESSISYIYGGNIATQWVVGPGAGSADMTYWGWYRYGVGRVTCISSSGNIDTNGYLQANSLINTYSEYQSCKGSGQRDWRFGCATGTGDTNWFGFYDYSTGFHGGFYGPDHSFRVNGTIYSYSGFYGSKGDLSEINIELVNSSCDIRLAAAASEKAGLYDVKSGSWMMYVYKSWGKVNFDNHVQAVGIWNNTTSSAANVRVASDGDLLHVSSASKYKIDIQDIQKDFGYEYNILKIKPRQWLDRAETEQYAKYLTDLYNDKLDRDNIDYREGAIGVNPCYGVIAEDVEKAGLSDFCEYGPIKEDGTKEIEGVQYERLPVLMIPILRDLVSCMNKILPYAKKGIDDDATLKEVEELEKRFNCFKDEDIINTKYDPETSKIIE